MSGDKGCSCVPSSNRKRRFLGIFEIKKEVDAVAAVALIVAIGSAIPQLLAAVRGANVEVIVPERVIINYEPYTHKTYVRFSAIMAYANTGAPGHSAVVRKEVLQYTVGEQSYVQVWQRFVQTERRVTDNQGNQELEIVDKNVAGPFDVAAGRSVSHETYYAPMPRKCEGDPSDACKFRDYLSASKFTELIEGYGETIMTFKFIVEIFGLAEEKVVSCEVVIDNNIRYYLENRGWASAPCREKPEVRGHNVPLDEYR